MDFLDPKRKRAHRRRLKIGYALLSIMIAIGTTLVLYLAYGYDVDRKTGELIQNGTVFVDSKPRGAQVYLDGVLQNSRTDTRMDIPAGTHTVKLRAEGYRDWERTFNLDGGSILRLTYPLLIPNVLQTSELATYDALPRLASQSLDRRWLVAQRPGQTYQFDLFDLNDPARPPQALVLPVALLSEPDAEASLRVIEWANSNRHVLLERSFNDKTEYIIFDREGTEHTNINTSLGITPQYISLRNQKFDQIYWTDDAGTLRSANLKDRTISAPLAQGVLKFESYDDNLLIYATNLDAEPGKTDFKIIENDKTYLLKSLSMADSYMLDINRYDNQWYYAVGASADNLVFVYQNPLPALKQEVRTPLVVTAILRLDNPRFMNFSDGGQRVSVQSGSQLLVLDLFDNRQYRTRLEQDIPLDQQLEWMDGDRFIFTIANQSYILDFDGSNFNTLVTSQLGPGPFFDRNFRNVLTFEPSKLTPNKTGLTTTILSD